MCCHTSGQVCCHTPGQVCCHTPGQVCCHTSGQVCCHTPGQVCCHTPAACCSAVFFVNVDNFLFERPYGPMCTTIIVCVPVATFIPVRKVKQVLTVAHNTKEHKTNTNINTRL